MRVIIDDIDPRSRDDVAAWSEAEAWCQQHCQRDWKLDEDVSDEDDENGRPLSRLVFVFDTSEDAENFLGRSCFNGRYRGECD
jgi:hypothetical protein